MTLTHTLPQKSTLSKWLLAAALSLGLTACGGGKSETTNQDSSPATAVSPAESSVLKVVTTGAEPPFSMVDEKGNFSGIDIEIMNELAKLQGLSITYQKQPWKNVLASVESGDADIAINAIKYSDERAATYALSQSYFYDPSAFAYKKDSAVVAKSLSDLAGFKVGVMAKSKQESDMANTQAIVTPYTNLFAAYRDMIQGKIDVVAYDLPVLQMTAKEQSHTLVFVPYESESDKSAHTVIAVKKGNDALLSKLNQGIATLKASGKIDEIGKKYTQ